MRPVRQRGSLPQKGCLKRSGDITAVTKIINGGTNGLDDRKARYEKAKSVLV